jgi:hypothetical protein
MGQSKKILYGKYIFNHNQIENNDIKQFIRNIKCDNLDGINSYKNLLSLTICKYSFNQPLDNLPETLQSLAIESSSFKQKLNKLPNGLLSLSLQCFGYDRSLGDLPNGLQSLEIIGYKGPYLSYTFPNSLKIISLNHCSDIQNIIDCLPHTLHSLEIHCLLFTVFPKNLPVSLHSLTISAYKLECSIEQIKFPSSLKYLGIRGKYFNQPINDLPSSLQKLIIRSDEFNQPTDNLPKDCVFELIPWHVNSIF